MKPKSNPIRMFTEYYYRWSIFPVTTTFHSHSQFEIYYFHSGRCDYLLGDRIIPLQSGDLIIMNGMTRHCPKVDPSTEYVRTMFSFDPHLVQLFGPSLLACGPLRPFELLGNHHIRLDAESKAECESILERIDNVYYKNDIINRNRLLSAFFDLLMLIYEKSQVDMELARANVSDRERHVQRMIAYIEDGYAEDIELDRMASDLHLNRFHMMKLFREVTGLTIFDYLYTRRVNQAKILFFHSESSTVTDVCFKVGFKHLSHFSRVFKKQVGMSPDQYRKMMQVTPAMAYK